MRLLVVEDEPELLQILAQALREAGYAVDEADDGAAGLHKTELWSYDAVLLDVMLPKLDGWAVLQRMRKTQTTPVLMITARDAVPERIRGLDLGADDYILKPFDLSEVLARVRAVIRRASGRARSIIEMGDVVLDTAKRTATKSGEAVVLTGREYAIVELLAHHRGEVVTKTRIYDHIFDENDDSLSNLVEVHVSNVRKKLGKDFIETRRGMGYVIHD